MDVDYSPSGRESVIESFLHFCF